MDDKRYFLFISYNWTIIVLTPKVGLLRVKSILTTTSVESNIEHETLFYEKIIAFEHCKWLGKLGKAWEVREGMRFRISEWLSKNKVCKLLSTSIYEKECSTLCLLISGCCLFTHFMGNMIICRVRMMFCGNGKWPLRTDGMDSNYFQRQLLVQSEIMPYLCLCWIVDSKYCSTCSYMTSSVDCIIRCTSFCILQKEVRWNISFCFPT